MSATGPCVLCNNKLVLNEAGLCPKCKDMPACLVHPEYLSSGRCLGCREYHCSLCMKVNRCEACRARPGKEKESKQRGPMTPKARFAAYIADARKNPVKAAVPVLGSLLAVRGLMFGLELLGDQKQVLTPEELYMYRLGAVQQACNELLISRGKLPASSRELYAQIGKPDYWLPMIQTKDIVLVPHAVIYLVKDGKYELRATDDEGELFAMNGKVVVMKQE